MARKKKNSKVDKGKVDADSSSEALTAEEVSKKYTVPELKYILKENGLKASGKKKDLVERVLPILNGDSGETSGEDVSNDSKEAKVYEVKKIVSAQSEDSGPVGDGDLSSPLDEQSLSSILGIFGINYEDLPIDDEIIIGGNANLNIRGFTQNGISMADSTLSIVTDSDSSSVDLKMNISEVSYSNFENTTFTFKNLDLSILPSSDPQSLEFSAIMDSLEIITENNYINLKGLNLLFKSFPDENGVRLDIDIKSFIYPDIYDASINFEGLDLNLSIGLDGQSLGISVNLPTLTLLSKDYRVNLSDLDLNVALSDTKLSNLDLSIVMSDFNYTNFDDVVLDMDNVKVSLEPISDLNDVNVIIGMDGMGATGLNSFDELFPMLDITGVNFKNPANDSESLVTLTCAMQLLDVSKMGLSGLGSLLSAGFDLDTYMSNMPERDTASLDVDAEDVSSTEASDSDDSGFDLATVFANCDYSGLDAIELDLTGLLDSTGIDLANFGIDVSNYDLSAISLSDLIGAVSSSEFIMTAVGAVLKLSNIDFEKLDFSGLIVSIDKDNFDISGLLDSLNLSESQIAGIIDMFINSGVDFAALFENCDYSCLGAIVLDLSGLIDSLGIDLADLGIDLSDYDLSAISLADIVGILSNFDFDMSTITAMLKLFGLDLDNFDLAGLIASFDADNFDISTLLDSLNLSGTELGEIIELFINSDVDLGSLFENCDYSSLAAIDLDLSGVIESAGIDISDLGIDMSDYDLSAISLIDLMAIFSNPDLDMSAVVSKLQSSGSELDNIDLSGLIARFDADNFDLAGLLGSLDLSGLDISGILDMFTNSDVDFAGIFENCDYSCLGAIVLDLSGLIDSLGIDLADLGIDLSDYDLSAISLAELIGILGNFDFDMSTITAMLKLFGIDLDDLDLSGLIASFDADNFDITTLLDSLNLSGLDISGIVGLFNNPDVDWGSIFENCDYSCLSAIVLDLTGLLDSAGIDLADFGIDVSDYDLSAISLSDLIDVLSKSEFVMSAMATVSQLLKIDWDAIDWSGLISGFDAENFNISGLLNSLDLSSLGTFGIMDNFDMNGLDLAEFLNGSLSLFIENTFPDAINSYDTEVICKSNVFALECLNKLFDKTFTNGHLKVCVDDELLFEGDTTDDLTQEIFEITEKCLGKHELTAEFAVGKRKSNIYEEKIIVE